MKMKVAGLMFVAATRLQAAKGAEAQAGAESHEVVRAGPATLEVTIRGQGDPIVFIPSRGRGVEDFDDLSRRLVQAGYRAILPQPRGIGGSTGPLEEITYHDLGDDVAATIESLVGASAAIVGHAFGGRVARTLAADHPSLVKRLILLAAPGKVPRSPEVEEVTNRVFDEALKKEERLPAIRRAFFASGNDGRAWEDGWYFSAARAQRASDGRTPLKIGGPEARRPSWFCKQPRTSSPSPRTPKGLHWNSRIG